MGRAMVFRDPALWASALQRAARELNLPPRGKKGSAENMKRRAMMSKVQKRAREIYNAKPGESRAEFERDRFGTAGPVKTK